ncbi:MAG TPA: TauD/TfdA family dioxygenase [Candidatus Angelobacter sp.]|jgi:hypothetical protein|nr:TauD/TfdA family dioxygenase [Candidatus Angelobacter sp.]
MQTIGESKRFELWRESSSNPLSGEELGQAADQIVSILTDTGYAHVRGNTTMEWCEEVSARVGVVAGKSDVIFDPDRDAAQRKTRSFKPDRPSVYLGGELGLHTDNPYWNVLGWYCVEQDPSAGANILIDTSDISTHFSSDELERLCSTDLWLPVRDASGKEAAVPVPVLTKAGQGYDIYWASWLKLDSYEEAQRTTLDRLGEWLLHKQETGAIEIRLRPGECLFVNNNRMLHGRQPLSEKSRRHLVRLSIRSSRVGAPKLC